MTDTIESLRQENRGLKRWIRQHCKSVAGHWAQPEHVERVLFADALTQAKLYEVEDV